MISETSRPTVCFFIVMIVLGLAALSYCQDNTAHAAISNVVGEITAIDWVRSIVTVRYPLGRSFGEAAFLIPRDIKIYKGNRAIQFFDINLSDKVRIDYYSDTSGQLKAVNIIVYYNIT